jgi:4-methyl-5(b-hydroxyethyl)-thiazole monophosphate biosynthesis
MSPSVLVILAPGFEEIEAVTVIDLLRRANLSVVVAGTVAGPLTASRQTRHYPDVILEEVQNRTFSMVVLPGGAEGTENLKKDASVRHFVTRHYHEGKWIAAICAAPTLLHEWGLLGAHRVICHPSFQAHFPEKQLMSDQRVVVDPPFITSLAAGTSFEFGFTIIEQLLGKETVATVNQGVRFHFHK